MAEQQLFVGTPVERVEDQRHLCGHAQFVDDLVFDGMLHASIVRSPVAHGRIRSIDDSAARAMPGVHDVIIAADIGSPVPTIPMRLQPLESVKPFRQPVIAQAFPLAQAQKAHELMAKTGHIGKILLQMP